MEIYNYDSEGYFIIASQADESPLEPGVFHIPALATDIKPMDFNGTTHRPRFVDGKWELTSLVFTKEEIDPNTEEVPPPLFSPAQQAIIDQQQQMIDTLSLQILELMGV